MISHAAVHVLGGVAVAVARLQISRIDSFTCNEVAPLLIKMINAIQRDSYVKSYMHLVRSVVLSNRLILLSCSSLIPGVSKYHVMDGLKYVISTIPTSGSLAAGLNMASSAALETVLIEASRHDHHVHTIAPSGHGWDCVLNSREVWIPLVAAIPSGPSAGLSAIVEMDSKSKAACERVPGDRFAMELELELE